MHNEVNMVRKKKLSKHQQRRLEINHTSRQQLRETPNSNDDQQNVADSLFSEPKTGLVISRYGKLADVEDEIGYTHRCNIRRTLPALVTGDRVIFRPSQDSKEKGIIDAILDRKSQFVRPDYYNGIKLVASNIDQIIIVSAVMPHLSMNIIDRYCVACEIMKIKPLILLNKIDLLSLGDKKIVAKQLSIYENIGYRVLFVSQKTQEGIASLKQVLADKTTIFVGQSGVGKSSLINLMLPTEQIQASVNAISLNSGLGQHTTTATKLYHLRTGGSIIDSPGVREFGLWHLESNDVGLGFIEFQDYFGHCRYRDCKHRNDPGCALLAAVNKGQIAQSRFNNYHRILETMIEMKTKNHRAYKQDKDKE